MAKRKTTRNAQGAGTIRQRSDGRWEARVTIGRDPGTGKQIQKSIYGKTQKEVRQKLQQTSVALDDGVYSEPAKITLKEWLDIWLADYIGNVKQFTRRSYQDQVNNHITPALGAVKLSALNTPSIQAFYNTLQAGVDEKKPLSPKTIKNIHGVLHKALQQAVSIGYLRFNPSDACTLPRVERKEIKPLTEDGMAAFLKEIEGHPWQALFTVDLFTGMRQGEILGLQWECIDFTRGTIFINKQLQREKRKGGNYILAPLKNDKSRLIAPAPTVMQALREHKKAQMQKQLLAGPAWDVSLGNLVFTNDIGGHLCHFTVWKQFKRLITKAGIPEARFHDLRHSYAVASIQAGDDIKTVQENLGHHTAAFTLDVYGHVTEQMKKDSANRMETFIKGIKKGT